VERADGARAWLAREQQFVFRVTAALSPSSKSIACKAEQCTGFIEKLWWRDQEVLFIRREGSGGAEFAVYAWLPSTGNVSTIVRLVDDLLLYCDPAKDRLICARQTPTRPAHVIALDLRSGKMQELADVNPEFRGIRLGKVERFEWETPKFAWAAPGQPLAGKYPERTYGYILYPPDFDPGKQYPVFIAPYSPVGFDNVSNHEYPLHVFAANDIVVLNTQFPTQIPRSSLGLAEQGKLMYSAELDFPHLSMYTESTVRALDVIAQRGFIDERRVGIGGLSHGAFVPLHMVLKHDRLAAVSVSSPGWHRWEYYLSTDIGRRTTMASYNWLVKPEGPGVDFWNRLDLADNIEAIEAPILMNLAASETMPVVRLIRHMADAGKPYDAYIYVNETHVKWQPAHLHAIAMRNLDWFRFWLQGYEDPDPAKSAQYRHWRILREQQAGRERRQAGRE